MPDERDEADQGTKLPDANEVAASIYIAAHNARHRVRISDDELREASRREKLREGFRVAVSNRLSSLGCEVKTGPGMMIVELPDDERTISLREAKLRSAEAQEDGMRSIDSLSDTLVLYPNGSPDRPSGV